MNITDRMTRLILARRPKVGSRGIRRAIADACGISYEAVRQWFSGNTGSIRNENLIAIAETFDTTIDWLLAGDGEPPTGPRPKAAAPSLPSTCRPFPWTPSPRPARGCFWSGSPAPRPRAG
ncbi:helix-turn-helix domain-containing protein [Azotobacter sp. CWF10]